jgi:Arc/MetJ-type ribon-helix-helix transcriptional regulator
MSTNRKSDKSLSVPVSDHNVLRDWINSGESPYVSVDEAYRDAIRNILYNRWHSMPINKKKSKKT